MCRGIGWNLAEFDVNITWRMLGGDHPNCYASMPITSDMIFNTMFKLITAKGLQILKLYLSRKPKVENFSSLELTRVPSYSQRTT